MLQLGMESPLPLARSSTFNNRGALRTRVIKVAVPASERGISPLQQFPRQTGRKITHKKSERRIAFFRAAAGSDT